MTAPSSPRNPRVRAAAELRDRRAREAAGLTLVDGVRELSRAVAAGAEVREAFVDPDRLAASPDGVALLARLRAGAGSMHVVPEAVLGRLAYGDRSEGVVATVAIPPHGLEHLDPPADALLVVLEGVEKPGNLGAVLRSADAAGAHAVIAASPRADLYNPNAVRASLGTIFTVPVAAAPASEVILWLRAHRIRPVAARVDGSVPWTGVDYRGPVALVLGTEAEGLSAVWRGDDVAAVRLPMLGVADSLNVSITAAVLLYEARRQRDA